MLLMIDNYDSFTYNLVQYFGELGEDVRVARNDQITLEEIAALNPDRICVSPGPSSPAEAGISVPVIQAYAGKKPILGVCLGHQAIGAAFGGDIVRAQQIMHGKTVRISHTGTDIFTGLPTPYTVIRYNSLTIDPATLPDCLAVTYGARQRHHGRAPQDPAAIRRAVPSRVRAQRARPRAAAQFPEPRLKKDAS